MLGIGRTSTQTTLASIETTGPGSSTPSTEADRGTAYPEQPTAPPTLSPPLRVNTTDSLSTITEGNSPARQSPAGFRSSSPHEPPSERSPSLDRIGSGQIREVQDRQVPEGGNIQLRHHAREDEPSASRATFWPGGFKQNFRNKIRSQFRKIKNFTINRQVSSAVTPSIPQLLPPVSTHQTDVHHEDPNPSPSNQSGPRSGQPDRLTGLTPTPLEKHERLRVQRREATLKRKVEMMARCECRSECQCRHGSAHSNAASYEPGDSDRSIQVPNHVLGNLLGEGSWGSASQTSSSVAGTLSLATVGVHLEDGNPDSGEFPNTSLEGRQSLDDRLSQASTAYLRSNGSSISLVSRRPSPMRRANTAPGPMRRATPGYRPGVLEALQNRFIPDQIHAPGSGASNSSRNNSVETEEASATTPDDRGDVPDVLSSQDT
ncbi:MAG: hypothetical protein LQ341_001787 [Variospora aurantia]|nr:MAG: hypothetical protein LQ341_001787 [Variospora aurantia]